MYVGDVDHTAAREVVIKEVTRYFEMNDARPVASEKEAHRSLVICPGGRWLQIGDTAGSTEFADSRRFEDLSLHLSVRWPVIDVTMSDSAIVHFLLFRGGRLIDKFGNGRFPWNSFSSEQEGTEYLGQTELWADLLLPDTQPGLFRTVWDQCHSANELLARTAALFGWNSETIWVGYTFDDEGIPIKYDRFLALSRLKLAEFHELHFRGVETESD